MKVKLSGVRCVRIAGDFIRLDALLKFATIVPTGGEAKLLIQSGKVFVDGKSCTLRGKKIRPGSVVRYRGETLAIKANEEA